MNGFIVVITTLLCLTLLFLATKNDQRHEGGLRATDSETIHSDDEVEVNHRSLPLTLHKPLVDPKLGTELTQRYQNYLHARYLDAAVGNSSQVVEYVSVDITFKSILDNERAQEVLRPAVPVIDFINCFQYMCSTRVPVSALKDISNIDAVQVLQLVQYFTQVGSITSEGDTAIKGDVARSAFSVDGNGLLIGVLADSYDCAGGAAADIASDDLPSGANSIVIVSDLTAAECTSLKGEDEGRAMMQVIHDVAPGARLAFRTAARGQADFAVGITELAAAGCDVMVDDMVFPTEPMFQDGILAQAVNQVVSQGIPFFSAAGNNARRSWDAPNGFIPVSFGVRDLHRFGTAPDGSPITRMQITMLGDGRLRTFVFQWDQPSGIVSGTVGPQSDIDLYILLNDGTFEPVSVTDNIGSGNPYEKFERTPTGGVPVTYELVLSLFDGPAPTYMKLVVFGGDVTFEFPTNSGTSYGHANAALAAGVGAASYTKTSVFGVAPPEIESFSSAGGVPIFLAKDGSRLPSPEIRKQPRVIGPDGVANTFFGQQDGNGIWRFFGTSAAVAHVAAVAALMLELKGGRRSITPAQIYSALEAAAVDMDDPFTPGFDVGFDFGTGFGLVNAGGSLLALVLPPIPPVAPPVVPPVAPPAIDCTITFDLFNAREDTKVVTLTNGVTITNPPPCGYANIEAVVPCGDSDGKVTIELYQGTKKIRKATDSGIPYFLWGNYGSDVKKGKIKAGSYSIRAEVNGVWSPFTSFTLGGTCSKRAR